MSFWVSAGVAIGTALIAGGTEYYNTKQTEHKQDQQLAANLRDQQAKQRKADQMTQQLIQKTGQSSAKPYQSAAKGAYLQALQSTQHQADAPLQQAGNVSKAYDQSAKNAALGVSNYGNETADLLSRIQAPSLQRQQEAIDQQRFGTGLGGVKRAARGQDFLDQLKLRGIKRNPWLDLFASAAASAGKSYAGRTGGGGGGGATLDNGASTWTDSNGLTVNY